MNARSTTEDCTLGGYQVPKDTILMLNLYVMSRDEKVFPNPDEFHPERWLREGRDENEPLPHPFSLLPFGSGVRSCVGRRVAEIQMYLATIQVLQRYSLKKSDVFDIKPFVRTQLTPGPELPVMFLERARPSPKLWQTDRSYSQLAGAKCDTCASQQGRVGSSILVQLAK
ncbi:sterol 26-hydroxylase, mitochondrial [Elysia marginata]|uniref:Cholesterol side-chain cleavage enzyme, mitochondrial n=1 Tax=Elysia marginata TaxID=1093978 RepID=A0AAV4GMZ1_9GAST|nr:sterol 26-hydroxylase, mitochondrial [Elysia marginata]